MPSRSVPIPPEPPQPVPVQPVEQRVARRRSPTFEYTPIFDEDEISTSDIFTATGSASSIYWNGQAMSAVPRLQTLDVRNLPRLGTVVEYNGHLGGPDLIGTKGVITAYCRGQLTVRWLTEQSSRNPRLGPQCDYVMLYLSEDQSQAEHYSDAELCRCEYCGSQGIRNESWQHEGHYFCDGQCAAERGWFTCASCSVIHHIDSTRSFNTGDGLVCVSCHTQNYSRCRRCEHFFRNDDLHEYMTDEFCTSCLERLSRPILDHSFKPYTILYNKMPWENTRYLGIELEVEIDDGCNRDSMVKKIKKWLAEHGQENAMYFKYDGSLDNGFEIVFHPYTLQAIHKKFPMKEFLDFLVVNGVESHDSGRCGLHVHVTKVEIDKDGKVKELLTRLDLLKAKWFFHKCQGYIASFSQRKDFHFCRFEDNIPAHNNPYEQPHGKYSALNVAASPQTIEFRVFRGTTNYYKFMANLQFAQATIDFVHHVGGPFLRKSYPAVVWQAFIDYSKRTNRYKIMTNWILKHKIV